MKSLPVKLTIGIVIAFSIVLLCYAVYEPLWYKLQKSRIVSDDETRRDIAATVVAAKGSFAIPHVTKWLESKDNRLVRGACLVLKKMEDDTWKELTPQLEAILDAPKTTNLAIDPVAEFINKLEPPWEDIYWSAPRKYARMCGYIIRNKIETDERSRYLYPYETMCYLNQCGGTETAKVLLDLCFDLNVDEEYRSQCLYYLKETNAPNLSQEMMDVLVNRNISSHARVCAAYILGCKGCDRAFGPLLTALRHDSSTELRAMAATALGNLLDNRAVMPLIKVMSEDREEDVRAACANALSDLDDPRATKPLIEALSRDGSDVVKAAAASTLGRLRIHSAFDALERVIIEDYSHFARKSALQAIVRLDDDRKWKTFEEIVNNDISDEIRLLALYALSGHEKDVFDTLLNALKNDLNEDIRTQVIIMLGRTGDSRAFEMLLKNLNTENDDLGQKVISAFVEIGDKRAIGPLIKVLRSQRYESVRMAAAIALGALGDERGFDTILRIFETHRRGSSMYWSSESMLDRVGWKIDFEKLKGLLAPEKPVHIQVLAIKMIRKSRNPEAFDILRKNLLENEHANVRTRCVNELGTYFRGKNAQALIAALTGDNSSAVRAAAAVMLGDGNVKEAVPALISALDNASDISSLAAIALGQISDNRAILPLMKTLDSEHTATRMHAARVLGSFGDNRATSALIDLYQKAVDPEVRKTAVTATGNIGDPSVYKFLCKLTKEAENSGVRAAAASGLIEHFGDRAIKPVMKTLRNSTSTMRGIIASSLFECSCTWATEYMLEKFESEPSGWVRNSMLCALSRSTDKRVGRMLIKARFYRDVDHQIDTHAYDYGPITDQLLNLLREAKCLWAGGILVGEKDGRTFEPLLRMVRIEPEGDKGSAINLLASLGDRRAVPVLLRLLEITCAYEERQEIVEALGMLGDKRAVKPLIDVLKNELWWSVRSEAAVALGHIGTPEVLQPLLDMIEIENSTAALHNITYALLTMHEKTRDPRILPVLEKAEQEENIRGIASIAWIKGPGKVRDFENRLTWKHRRWKFKPAARWGDVECLGNVIGWLQSPYYAEAVFYRDILERMPAEFPAFRFDLPHRQMILQHDRVKEWYQEHKDSLAWNAEKRMYYLK